MEQFIIENDKLKVGINQKGAELASIQSKQNGKEYIWQADPEFWGRHSCILFPIVGKLKNEKYQLDGKTYEMKQHGFVRNRLFKVHEQLSNQITFRYKSEEEDKTLYPFEFAVNMKYVLEGDTLSVIYEVENKDDVVISFSIGGHPAFNCPLNEGEKRSDYALLFEKAESAESHTLNDDGLFDGKTKKVFDGTPKIEIRDELFDDDALVFKGLKSSYVSLVNKEEEKILTFNFEEFPSLGIWSQNRKSPFVCIEPWFGHADNASGQDDFRDKEGVCSLDIGKVFSCKHTITIH